MCVCVRMCVRACVCIGVMRVAHIDILIWHEPHRAPPPSTPHHVHTCLGSGRVSSGRVGSGPSTCDADDGDLVYPQAVVLVQPPPLHPPSRPHVPPSPCDADNGDLVYPQAVVLVQRHLCHHPLHLCSVHKQDHLELLHGRLASQALHINHQLQGECDTINM